MDLGFVRSYNESAVLGLVRGGAITRVELAARSGLTPQAVSKIVARLIVSGLLVESGTVNVGVGKPRTLLSLVPSGAFSFGVHVDRDELRVVRCDLTGAVVAGSVTPLPVGFTPAVVVDMIEAQAKEIAVPGDRVLGMGVGIAGPLDFRSGVVHYPNGLPGWQDVPLRTLLSERMEMPVVVDKDTNLAVVAEAWDRIGDFAVVYAGTGLGAGLFLDGRVHRGARSGAGEFGHTTIQLDGPQCVCGRSGCVEAVHRELLSSGSRDLAIKVLGIAAQSLVQLLDVSAIILSGRSVNAAPDEYVSGVAACVPTSSWLPVDVVMSKFGADLVATGAAMLVLGELFS